MGELNPEHFPDLFAQRKKLTVTDIAFAHQVWEAYVGQDALKLASIAKDVPAASFPYLSEAIFHYQTLFPHQKNGLNAIEQQLLSILESSKLKSIHQWVGNMLTESNPYFGFGDLQYYDAIRRIQALWEQHDAVKLTTLGEQVLKNEIHFLDIQSESYAIGGAKNYDFVWDGERLELMRA